MKYLVESVDHAPLLDPTSGDHVAALRPSVVWATPFIETLITEKRVTKLKALGDEADDQSFMAAYRDDKAKALAGLPAPAKKA